MKAVDYTDIIATPIKNKDMDAIQSVCRHLREISREANIVFYTSSKPRRPSEPAV